MTEPAQDIDFDNLPAPAEGILVTLFVTVRKVARSRAFYSEVLGGTVVLPENPCIVKLANSWIIMNPGGHHPGRDITAGRSTGDRPFWTDRQPGQQRRGVRQPRTAPALRLTRSAPA